MNRLAVAPTRVEDLGPVAANMREEDRLEVLAASGDSPLEALTRGFAQSAECWTVHSPGGPIAIFGVVALDSAFGGAPWLLGTPGMTAYWFEFARRSRDEFHHIRSRWPYLTNYVDDRNELHKRWLSWLGFDFVEVDAQHGVGKLPFWRFECAIR